MLLPLPGVPSVSYTYRNVEIVGGGFVTGVIPHPRAKGLVYARTDIGGAYRLGENGRWVPLQDWITKRDWNLYGIESLAVDPSDADRVYLAAGTYTNDWAGNGAILRSADRGRTWKRTDLPFKNGGNMPGRSMGERLSVDPNDGRHLLFGTRTAGLWRSRDRGATWAQVPGLKSREDGVGVAWTLFDPNSRLIFAGVGGDVFRSRDGGATWGQTMGGPRGFRSHQAKVAPDGTLVIAFADREGPNDVMDGAVWRFDPRTVEWTDITPEKPGPGNTFGYGGVAVHGKTILASTLCRWAKGDTVFRSTDAGRTWTSLEDSSVRDASRSRYLDWDRKKAEFGHWIGDVEMDPFRPERAWYVTGATIWGTSNLSGSPSRWVPAAEGIEETAVNDLISPPSGAHLLSGLSDIGGFRHDDFRRSPASGIWTNPVLVTTTDLDYAGLAPNVVARVGYRRTEPWDSRSISLDGGRTWRKQSGMAGGSVAVSADGAIVAHAAQLSADGKSGEGLPMFARTEGVRAYGMNGPNALVRSPGHIVADRVRPGIFTWVDTRAGLAYVVRDLKPADLPSTAPGDDYKFPWGEPGATGLELAEDARPVSVLGRAGHLWLPSKRGLLRSTDHGMTFSLVPGLDAVEQVGLGKALRPGGYPALYAIGRIGAVEGVFRSTDEGASWVRVNDARSGFGTMQRIEGDPRVFGRFYLGTNGRGVLVAEPRS